MVAEVLQRWRHAHHYQVIHKLEEKVQSSRVSNPSTAVKIMLLNHSTSMLVGVLDQKERVWRLSPIPTLIQEELM